LKIIVLLHLLVMLVGCNSELASLSPLRKTRIKITPTLPTSVTAYSIMLWGSNADGSAFSRIVEQDKVSTFIFPNGSVTLYAMAWSGINLTGDVYCSTTPAALTGPDQDLTLALTNDDCDVPHFRAAALSGTTPKTLGTLKVQWCETLTNLTSGTDECTDDLASVNRKEARGHAMSYRFVIPTFDKTNSRYSLRSDSITSACIKGSPAAGSELKGLAEGLTALIPSGDGSSTPFYISLETFQGSSTCDSSSHGVKAITFKNGIQKNDSSAKYFAEGAVAHKLYVKLNEADLCTTVAKSKTFAGGDGSRGAPYLICNSDQFYNTQTTRTSSFKLLSDIDLTKNYYSKTTLPNIPDGLTCLEKGSNFFPLGYELTCSAGVETFATSDFDGGGKTLTGLRIKMAGKDFVGLYTKKNGGEIRRLNLKDITIQGQSNVGALAGVSNTMIRNIKGDSIFVSASGASAGSLAGLNSLTPSPCEFRDIRLEKLSVSSTSYAGGLLGQSSSCDFYNSSLSGYIFSAASYAGGVTSNILNGTIKNVSFEGYVKGTSYVGGLAGDLFNSIVTENYVQADILGSHTGAGVYAGGLIGFTNATPTATSYVTDNYFFGQLDHYCQAVPATDCSISNIIGDPGLWGAGSLSSNYYVSTNATSGRSALDTGTSRAHSLFFSTAAAWPAAFSLSNTDLPRLPHEIATHPCRTTSLATETVATQVAAGLGTRANPVSICNFSQLKDMQANASHATKSYKLLSFILGTEEVDPSTLSFSGVLDGNNKAIIRLAVRGLASTDVAWWKSIGPDGVMKNLYFIDARIIDSTNNAATTALVAKTNFGELNAVHTLTTRSLPGAVGEHSLYVHTNAGTIKNSYINGTATVRQNVAGVMYVNQGTFEDSWASSYLGCNFGVSCNNMSGLTIDNQGTVRRVELLSSVIDQTAFAANSNFSFLAIKNTGTIEDIHILPSSKLFSKTQAIHGIVAENRATGTVRRIYNEGRVRVANSGLPSLNPITSADYLNGATNTVGFNVGAASHIAYKYIPRWGYPSQYGAGPQTVMGPTECKHDVSGNLPPAWESTMITGLFTRFGIMVYDEGEPYLFTRIPVFGAGTTTMYAYDAAPCSMGGGNPIPYFVPFDVFNGAGQINQSESLMYSTFSTWSGVLDITLDPSPVQDYEYDKVNGISSSKPVWIFDTTNSLRLYH
jgi:hypothetical protein